MPDNLASAFVQSYGAMQENQRQNQAQQDSHARQLAQDAFDKWKMANGDAQTAYEQDPNNPRNTLLAAQTENEKTKYPALMAKIDEQDKATAARQKIADERQDGIDVRNATIAWENGTPPGTAAAALSPKAKAEFLGTDSVYGKPETYKGIMATLFADYDKKSADTRKTVADAIAAHENPGQGMAGGAAAGLAQSGGNPFGAAMGAMGGGLEDSGQIQKIIQDNYGALGLPPDASKAMQAIHPKFVAQMEKDAANKALLAAKADFAVSQKARLDAITATIPEVAKSLEDLRAAKIQTDKERTSIMKGNAAVNKYYKDGMLDVAQAKLDISQQLADNKSLTAKAYAGINDPAARQRVGDSKAIRNAVQGELSNANRELTAVQGNIDKMQAKVGQYAAMIAPYKDPATGQINQPLTTPVPGANGMTLGQLDKTVAALSQELDPKNETSLVYQRDQLRQRKGELISAVNTPGLDRMPVTGSGTPIKTPTPAAPRTLGKPAPVTSGADIGSKFLKKALPRR